MDGWLDEWVDGWLDGWLGEGVVGHHARRNAHGHKFLEKQFCGIWNGDLRHARGVLASPTLELV